MDTKIDIGIKYADKQARRFDEEKMKAGQCVIGLQVSCVGYEDQPLSFPVFIANLRHNFRLLVQLWMLK